MKNKIENYKKKTKLQKTEFMHHLYKANNSVFILKHIQHFKGTSLREEFLKLMNLKLPIIFTEVDINLSPDFKVSCQKKHKDYFIHNNTDISIAPQVMNVPLMKRINHLVDFVNFYFTNSDPPNNDVNLFLSMLTLEISPCLQIAILNTISILFSRKLSEGRKKKIFGAFIDKEFLDILKYVFADG